ncbi:hypothetical protein SK128_010800, partial [Halocaridina rubra]
MLRHHQPLVKPMSFIGQGSGKRERKGITQKEQLMVVKQFKEGGFNTLISTCVGEEGLDIGDVDLIICYDAPKSPIRLVQRMGRTGRKREGRIVVLVTAGKEEQMYNQSQYQKKYINSALADQKKISQYLFTNCAQLIPPGLTPTCQKLHMTRNEWDSKPKSVRKRNALTSFSSKTSSACTSSSLHKVKQSLLSEEERHWWKETLWVPQSDIKTVPQPSMVCLTKKRDDNETSNRNIIKLGIYQPWQTTLQPTHHFGHSLKSKHLVQLTEFIDLHTHLDLDDDPYGLEMAAFFDESYVKDASPLGKKHQVTSAPDKPKSGPKSVANRGSNKNKKIKNNNLITTLFSQMNSKNVKKLNQRNKDPNDELDKRPHENNVIDNDVIILDNDIDVDKMEGGRGSHISLSGENSNVRRTESMPKTTILSKVKLSDTEIQLPSTFKHELNNQSSKFTSSPLLSEVVPYHPVSPFIVRTPPDLSSFADDLEDPPSPSDVVQVVDDWLEKHSRVIKQKYNNERTVLDSEGIAHDLSPTIRRFVTAREKTEVSDAENSKDSDIDKSDETKGMFSYITERNVNNSSDDELPDLLNLVQGFVVKETIVPRDKGLNIISDNVEYRNKSNRESSNPVRLVQGTSVKENVVPIDKGPSIISDNNENRNESYMENPSPEIGGKIRSSKVRFALDDDILLDVEEISPIISSTYREPIRNNIKASTPKVCVKRLFQGTTSDLTVIKKPSPSEKESFAITPVMKSSVIRKVIKENASPIKENLTITPVMKSSVICKVIKETSSPNEKGSLDITPAMKSSCIRKVIKETSSPNEKESSAVTPVMKSSVIRKVIKETSSPIKKESLAVTPNVKGSVIQRVIKETSLPNEMDSLAIAAGMKSCVIHKVIKETSPNEKESSAITSNLKHSVNIHKVIKETSSPIEMEDLTVTPIMKTSLIHHAKGENTNVKNDSSAKAAPMSVMDRIRSKLIKFSVPENTVAVTNSVSSPPKCSRILIKTPTANSVLSQNKELVHSDGITTPIDRRNFSFSEDKMSKVGSPKITKTSSPVVRSIEFLEKDLFHTVRCKTAKSPLEKPSSLSKISAPPLPQSGDCSVNFDLGFDDDIFADMELTALVQKEERQVADNLAQSNSVNAENKSQLLLRVTQIMELVNQTESQISPSHSCGGLASTKPSLSLKDNEKNQDRLTNLNVTPPTDNSVASGSEKSKTARKLSLSSRKAKAVKDDVSPISPNSLLNGLNFDDDFDLDPEKQIPVKEDSINFDLLGTEEFEPDVNLSVGRPEARHHENTNEEISEFLDQDVMRPWKMKSDLSFKDKSYNQNMASLVHSRENSKTLSTSDTFRDCGKVDFPVLKSPGAKPLSQDDSFLLKRRQKMSCNIIESDSEVHTFSSSESDTSNPRSSKNQMKIRKKHELSAFEDGDCDFKETRRIINQKQVLMQKTEDNKKPHKQRKGSKFIEYEADVSDDSIVVSTDESENDNQYDINDSFVDDAPEPSQDPKVDIKAVYLKSIVSPVRNVVIPRCRPATFISDTDEEEDEEEDSFVVGNDVVEYNTEYMGDSMLAEDTIMLQAILENFKDNAPKSSVVMPKNKRKRIISIDSSSSSEEENLNIENKIKLTDDIIEKRLLDKTDCEKISYKKLKCALPVPKNISNKEKEQNCVANIKVVKHCGASSARIDVTQVLPTKMEEIIQPVESKKLCRINSDVGRTRSNGGVLQGFEENNKFCSISKDVGSTKTYGELQGTRESSGMQLKSIDITGKSNNGFSVPTSNTKISRYDPSLTSYLGSHSGKVSEESTLTSTTASNKKAMP